MTALAAFRTRIQNSLDDTNSKYSDDIIDEALRKILNEYTRANPNMLTAEFTVTTSGRIQTLSTANLIVITQLVHPYDDTLVDPFVYEREDFTLSYMDGSPTLYFSGEDIPEVSEIIYFKYAGKQTIKDLDSAAASTIRDDHEDILVVGASGQAAMMRASGLNEQWGGRPGEMGALMMWGTRQYARFLDFLFEVKQESNLPIFPDTFWPVDKWDE